MVSGIRPPLVPAIDAAGERERVRQHLVLRARRRREHLAERVRNPEREQLGLPDRAAAAEHARARAERAAAPAERLKAGERPREAVRADQRLVQEEVPGEVVVDGAEALEADLAQPLAVVGRRVQPAAEEARRLPRPAPYPVERDAVVLVDARGETLIDDRDTRLGRV